MQEIRAKVAEACWWNAKVWNYEKFIEYQVTNFYTTNNMKNVRTRRKYIIYEWSLFKDGK